jgi:hypothetical protein
VRKKRPEENRHETTDFFCKTPHLHIGHWWSKSIFPSTMWRVCSISPTLSVFATKKYSERSTIRKRRWLNCKSDESTEGGIENCFPGMLPKALWTLAKACHCLRELLQRKFCVNRCNVTYFCVVNQLRELF